MTKLERGYLEQGSNEGYGAKCEKSERLTAQALYAYGLYLLTQRMEATRHMR